METAHGAIETPAFMPVGTAATVKAMLPECVRATGAEILLGNTYHLMLRPGAERDRAAGRPAPVHELAGADPDRFRRLPGDEPGRAAQARPRRASPSARIIDGTEHLLTPERPSRSSACSVPTSSCASTNARPFPPPRSGRPLDAAVDALGRALPRTPFGDRPGHALFGIVQGGVYRDLRAESAEALRESASTATPSAGLAVGEGQEAMFARARLTRPACCPRTGRAT